MEKITKSFPAFITKVDTELGIVESIVSVLGNIDLGDDIIHSGAFTKTITERFGKLRVLDNHNSFSVLNVVGKCLEARELSKNELPQELLEKYPSSTGGIYTKTQYLLDTDEGLGVFKRIKAGAIDEYSIGFSIPRGKYDISKVQLPDGTVKQVRNIREVVWYEYSPVIWAMNDATMTLDAKSEHKELSLFDIEMKVMSAFNDLHLMAIGEMDEYGYQEKEGYRCSAVYLDYLLCRPHKIESEYEFYKVNYSHNFDYSDITFANQEDWQGGNFQFVIGAKSLEEIDETKAGRMISSANMAKINAAIEVLQALISSANSDALDNSENNMNSDNDNKSDNNTVDTGTEEDTLITVDDKLDVNVLKQKYILYLENYRKN